MNYWIILYIWLYYCVERKNKEESEMPTISISLLEGRDVATKQLLCERLTNAVVETLNVKKEVVSVHIWEMKPDNLGKAGVLKSQTG